MAVVRRRQLIDATIKSIHAHGFGATTIQTIGFAAGLSPGIIHHYFGGKNELLAATMRHLLEELRTDYLARLPANATPAQRVHALLEANFDEKQFTPDILAAWLAFWSQAPFSPQIRRLRRVYSRRTLSILLAALRSDLPEPAARQTAATLMALIDGFWLRAAQGDEDVTAASALAIARDTLDRALGQAGPTPTATPSAPVTTAPATALGPRAAAS